MESIGDLGDVVGECNNFGEDDGKDLIKFGCELFCVFKLHGSLEKERINLKTIIPKNILIMFLK